MYTNYMSRKALRDHLLNVKSFSLPFRSLSHAFQQLQAEDIGSMLLTFRYLDDSWLPDACYADKATSIETG